MDLWLWPWKHRFNQVEFNLPEWIASELDGICLVQLEWIGRNHNNLLWNRSDRISIQMHWFTIREIWKIAAGKRWNAAISADRFSSPFNKRKPMINRPRYILPNIPIHDCTQHSQPTNKWAEIPHRNNRKIDQNFIKNWPKFHQKWTKNFIKNWPKHHQKWTKNGPKMDQKWNENRTKFHQNLIAILLLLLKKSSSWR